MNHCAIYWIYSLVIWHFIWLSPFNGLVDGQNITAESTVCKTGYGYPLYCPQPGDSPEHTKCCRHFFQPRCCKERATMVCAGKTSSKTGKSNWDPDLSWVAVWCPQDDQPDDHTACKYNNGQVGCMSYKVVIGIIAGVFGAVFLILVVIGVACFVCYKKGKLVCVKVRPGKYKMRMVNKQQQQQQQQQQQHIGPQHQQYNGHHQQQWQNSPEYYPSKGGQPRSVYM